MRNWLFKTPLRAAVFLLVTGVIFTAVTIGIGVDVGWDLGAVVGSRDRPAWFILPAGLALGIGSALLGGFQLVAMVVRRVRPTARTSRLEDLDGEPLDLD